MQPAAQCSVCRISAAAAGLLSVVKLFVVQLSLSLERVLPRPDRTIPTKSIPGSLLITANPGSDTACQAGAGCSKRLGTLATPGDGSGLTRLKTPSETVGADTGDLNNLFRVGGIMASCGIQDSAGLQLVRIACKAVFNSGHNKAQ
eukprot:593021-Hanusia_phi.AAC.1